MGDNNYFDDDFDSAANTGVSKQEGRALCEEARDLARDIRIAQIEFDICANRLSGFEIDSGEWRECIDGMKKYSKQIIEYRDLADVNVDYLKSLRTGGLNENF